MNTWPRSLDKVPGAWRVRRVARSAYRRAAGAPGPAGGSELRHLRLRVDELERERDALLGRVAVLRAQLADVAGTGAGTSAGTHASAGTSAGDAAGEQNTSPDDSQGAPATEQPQEDPAVAGGSA